MPTVSIIITVYNGAEYLAECLDSILSQTLENIEIICVDDASTDATPHILLEYRNRITVITNDINCMAGESRNKGLRFATGEYVIFLDADDVFEPDMLAKAYYKAKSYKSDICIFKEDLFGESIIGRNNYSYAEHMMEELGNKDFFSPLELSDALFSLWNGWAWDKLFCREFIMHTGLQFQKLKTSNDAFFVHAALASANRISLVNEVLVHHRTGNGGSLSNTRDSAWESCLMYLKELRRYLIQKQLFLAYERSYLNWTAEFLYWNFQTLNAKNRGLLAEAMRPFLQSDLNITQFAKEYFYNTFSWWFINCIMNGDEDTVPLKESEHFEQVYRLNAVKIDSLHQYFLEHKWKIAIWGAGIRGCAFARIYGNVWTELRTVYDMDESKWGKELCSGITVRGFDGSQAEKTDCVIVLNSAHLLSVQKLVPEGNITLFDMNTYLNLCDRLEECFISCEE